MLSTKSSEGDSGSIYSDEEDYSERQIATVVGNEVNEKGGLGNKKQGGESLVMSFTEKELLTLQLLFLMLDRDDDGRITVQDLMALSEEVSVFPSYIYML